MTTQNKLTKGAKMTKLLTFHGKKSIKEKYVKRVRLHRKMDNIIQGSGWDGHKGCAVGCTLERYDHSQYPIELGIPEELGHLQDAIHEGLKVPDFKEWPELFLTTIEEGLDLSMVWPQFAIEILSNKDFGVLKYVQDDRYKQQKEVIETVLDLYVEWVLTGNKPAKKLWDAAGAAAWVAARDAQNIRLEALIRAEAKRLNIEGWNA